MNSEQLAMGRLLGFRDFFPNTRPLSKDAYAKLIGSDILYKFSAHFLSYFRLNAIPMNEQLLREWFTFNEVSFNRVPYYHYSMGQYKRLSRLGSITNLQILSIESLLNLFVWLNEKKDIPERVLKEDVTLTLPLFQLYLLFNDDVLRNYEVARKSVEEYKGKDSLQRMLLAMSFPQNDFLNADYAQLAVTQFYKALMLLEYISDQEEYQLLYRKFLEEYYCSTKEEFLRSIGTAVVLPLKNTQPGWSVLNVPQGPMFERDCSFLEKITVQSDDATLYEQNDYLSLRTNPLQKLKKGEYRIIYDQFLLKKVYNGLIFILSGLVKADKSLFPKDFLGTIRNDFSEGVLLYEVLKSIYSRRKVFSASGKEFKSVGIDREPDYYIRDSQSVLLFESKDFFIPGDVKLSYDFRKIEEALKNNRLEKAIKQLIRNVERVLLKGLKLDQDYCVNEVTIHPIIIVHDSLYSAPALNYWVHFWFEDGLAALQQKKELKDFDFFRVFPVTVVEVDTLIFYEEQFIQGQLNLETLIQQYHAFVNFRKQEFLSRDEIETHALQSAIPFAEFVRQESYRQKVELSLEKLFKLFGKFGII